MWQHICFSIDTTSSVWSFYKDGSLTDAGISAVYQKVASRHMVVGGQVRFLLRQNMLRRFQGNLVFHVLID